jgi:hypothetical protein
VDPTDEDVLVVLAMLLVVGVEEVIDIVLGVRVCDSLPVVGIVEYSDGACILAELFKDRFLVTTMYTVTGIAPTTKSTMHTTRDIQKALFPVKRFLLPIAI